VKSEVDAVEDEIDWRWNDGGDGAAGVRVGICVGNGGCESWGGVQGRVFKFGCPNVGVQVWVSKCGCSRLGVQVGVCRSGVVNSWLPSFDEVSLPTTSR
jgi:hypothetical protein